MNLRLTVIFFHVVILFLGGVLQAQDKLMSVQVKSAPVRANPAFLGKIVATLSYGDQVTVAAEKSGWAEIKTTQVSGWMHMLALTGKKIVLKAGQKNADIRPAGDEVALATRGFTKEVEAQYAAKHRQADYQTVNEMEKSKISEEEMRAFLEEGGLGTLGGAQ